MVGCERERGGEREGERKRARATRLKIYTALIRGKYASLQERRLHNVKI